MIEVDRINRDAKWHQEALEWYELAVQIANGTSTMSPYEFLLDRCDYDYEGIEVVEVEVVEWLT